MPSKNNIGKKSFILTISQIMVLGINMINVMLLSRFRTLAEYGTYSQVMMISTIIITFFSAGFSQCINYFLAGGKSDEEKAKFIKTYYTLVSFISIAGGVVSLLLLPFIKNYFANDAIGIYWFVMLLYPLSHIISSGVDRFFIVSEKTGALFFLKIIYSSVVLLEAVLAVVFNLSFYTYMIIYVCVEMANALLTFLWTKLITGVTPIGFDKNMAFAILKFAIPMALASLISTINTEMDKLIVGGFISTDQMAIFTNAAKELPVYIFSTSISSVTMPVVVRKLSKKENLEASKLWNSSIKLSFTIISFFVTVLFVFAPQVISVIYSDKYVPGVPVFRIYTLILLFRITYYGMMLNALGKTKEIMRSSVFTMIINLIMDVILYFAMGVAGPALATLISVVTMNMYQLILTKKYINVKFTDIYPVKYMIKCLTHNAVLGVIFFIVQQILFKHVDFNRNTLTIFTGCIWFMVYAMWKFKDIKFMWKELNT